MQTEVVEELARKTRRGLGVWGAAKAPTALLNCKWEGRRGKARTQRVFE